jgi:hypothetical protein
MTNGPSDRMIVDRTRLVRPVVAGQDPCSTYGGTPLTCGGAMERVTGIEPAWPAWKAGALPLSYTRAC